MNYIEHYDESSDYTFEIPELEIKGGEDLEQAVLELAPEIHGALLSALYNGITLGCDQVPVFAIKGVDSVVTIKRDQYAEKIDFVIGFYSKFEEYEICNTLLKLKAQL